jgi:hypothetical protein
MQGRKATGLLVDIWAARMIADLPVKGGSVFFVFLLIQVTTLIVELLKEIKYGG